jgi:fumarylacetoacetase
MRQAQSAPVRLALTNYRHAYWSAAQMLTHHTVNGCNLQPGDLLGTGTLSGPTLDSACALIELTAGGKNPIHLPNGEVRTWVEDGDAIILRGWCEKPGAPASALANASARCSPRNSNPLRRFAPAPRGTTPLAGAGPATAFAGTACSAAS